MNKNITEEANIYTLYSDNKPFYVGKTELLKDGKVKMEILATYYANKKLFKKVKATKNFKIRILARTTNEKKVWFNEKLKKHTDYLSKKYKLVNSSKIFGLNGYGYWSGKKRDKHTLKRLEESKYKPVVQYTTEGNFLRQWPSAKHASKHYKCYTLVNGSGSSPIHCALLGNRKWKNWMWYKVTELESIYGSIPQQLHKLDFDRPTDRHKRLILKCDKKCNVLDFYYTAQKAAKANGTTEYFIQQNLNTGNKFQNFYWKTDELRRDRRITLKV